MKTILHIIDTTGPGGAETVFIDLATRLPADKYRSVVVIRGKGWVYEELCRRGVQPILLDARGSFNVSYLMGLRRLIREKGVDLIQSHLLGANVYCSLAGLITGRPVIATFHGEVDIKPNERLVGLKFAAINMGSRRIVAVTDSLLQDIISRTSLSRKKSVVVYNGIETGAYIRPPSIAIRDRFGWHNNEIIVGSLGNIRPAKAYDILLKAAALLKNREIPFRFVIAGQGKGGLYDSLLALRKELGLNEIVQFLGFTDDAGEFLAGIDIFLSSSVTEGLPLSAIQAMVAARAIVATRVGGYVGLIREGETGVLIDAQNPEAIADALEKVASDSELREKMAQNAKQYAIETYDIEVMLRQYRYLYDEVA